jgi:quinol monooxygenase YgiN
MPVVVTAVFHPVDGSKTDLVEAFEQTIPAIHLEPGCLVYAIHDAEDGTITMIEKWASPELLEAHSQGDAVLGMRKAIAPFLTSRPIVTTMTPIPIGQVGEL